MSNTAQIGSRNWLLASLPAEDVAYLLSISRVEQPPPWRALTSRSEQTSDVWFPHTGVVALTATDAAGRSVQTGLVGCEGCVGLEALFDHLSPLPDAVVQIEGPMSVIPASQLRAAVFDRPPVHAALSRFLFGLSAQALQTIACNRLHSLRARCCRWLLTIQDRVPGDDLLLTQESLATLLGSGRPRISGLLAALEKNGLVRRDRGRIRLLTRSGLEASSCGCYKAVRHSSGSLYLR